MRIASIFVPDLCAKMNDMTAVFPVLIFMLCDELLNSFFSLFLLPFLSGNAAFGDAAWYHGGTLFLLWLVISALLSLALTLHLTGQKPRDVLYASPAAPAAASAAPDAPFPHSTGPGKNPERETFFLFSAAVFLCLFFNTLSALLKPYLPAGLFADGLSGASGSPALRFVVFCAVLPLVEEIVFRAVCFRELAVRTDDRQALLISSALFGLHHGALFPALYAFYAGVLFARLFRRGGIRASFITHACLNLLILVLSDSGILVRLSSPAFCAAFFALLLVSETLRCRCR